MHGIEGLDYEVDPITPFFGNDEVSDALARFVASQCWSMVRLVLTDSTVIAEYLDEAYPTPHPLPCRSPKRAPRWLARELPTLGLATSSSGVFCPKFVHPSVEGARRSSAHRAVAFDRHSGRARLS